MRSEIALLLLCGLSLLTSGCDRPSGEGGQGAGNTGANLASSPTPGEVRPSADAGAKPAFAAKIDRSHAGNPAPDAVFSGPDGKDVTLADFRGKPALVNLWATWCGPCVAEMPMLDAIAARDAGLAMVAVSQDMGERAEVEAFFKARGLRHMKLYRDPESQLGFHYATGLLPTSVLYDAEGKEVLRVVGALDWASDEAAALIEEARR